MEGTCSQGMEGKPGVFFPCLVVPLPALVPALHDVDTGVNADIVGTGKTEQMVCLDQFQDVLWASVKSVGQGSKELASLSSPIPPSFSLFPLPSSSGLVSCQERDRSHFLKIWSDSLQRSSPN